MKITAGLCWFDEPCELLDRCVRSLAGVADEVVALDGAWDLFPGAEPGGSGHEQQRAIRVAAKDVGLRALIAAPLFVYESQIAKRAALMQYARRDSDWVLVVDADDYLEPPAGDVRAALTETDLDVAEILASYRIGRRAATRPVRRLFRSSTGVTVTGAHNGYRAADGRWLHAPSNIATEPALDLTGVLRLAHDSSARPAGRRAAMECYYEARAASGEETLRYEVAA